MLIVYYIIDQFLLTRPRCQNKRFEQVWYFKIDKINVNFQFSLEYVVGDPEQRIVTATKVQSI